MLYIRCKPGVLLAACGKEKRQARTQRISEGASTIRASFEPYYRTTILSEETDPNKLHDLKADLDGYQIYATEDVQTLTERYLSGADRDELDPILDTCVALYTEEFDEDDQVDFKSKAKAFIRTYDFLASILPYANVEWEKLSIFLNFLVPKLPAPVEQDLARGILESIDMESYRVEKRAAIAIELADEDAEIGPVPAQAGGRRAEPELDILSTIIEEFNDQFGDIPWTDEDRIQRLITEEIPQKVAADPAYRNAQRNNDAQNARIEHNRALESAMSELVSVNLELLKHFSDNPGFKRWLSDTTFNMTYGGPQGEGRKARHLAINPE